jgi:hypothetical protein
VTRPLPTSRYGAKLNARADGRPVSRSAQKKATSRSCASKLRNPRRTHTCTRARTGRLLCARQLFPLPFYPALFSRAAFLHSTDRLSGFPRRSARGSVLERERAKYGATRTRDQLLQLQDNAQASVSLCALAVYPNIMTRAIRRSFIRWDFAFPFSPSLSFTLLAPLSRKVSRRTRRVNCSLKCFTTLYLISARKGRAGSLAHRVSSLSIYIVTSRLRKSLAEMNIDALIIIRIFSSIVDIHFFLFASDISRVNYGRAEVRSLTSNALALDKFATHFLPEDMKIIPGEKYLARFMFNLRFVQKTAIVLDLIDH